MIYTITFNPALDYAMVVEKLTWGQTNRALKTSWRAGGKGVNGAIILKRLGFNVITSGFLGTENNHLILETLKREKIMEQFIPIVGQVRTNVKIKSDIETEINGNGPLVIASAYEKFLQLISTFKSSDFVMISGNLGLGMEQVQLDILLRLLNEKKVKFSLDIHSQTLKQSLKHQPLIIKPNLAELSEISELPLDNHHQIMVAIQQLQTWGAQNVLVSLGSQGAIYVSSTSQSWFVSTIKARIVNCVGAGDSMLATFVGHHFIKHKSIEDSLKMAAASGLATCLDQNLGTKVMIEKLAQKIKITTI